ncbi:MAG: Mrp/NBP35 family ATP-binding protein [Leptospiraceae bacterium]|nr:Mrp/NBP35 family ATP-binding protein [Leptospiraceae bacterium]
MLSVDEVKKELIKIKHPEIKKDIVFLGMLSNIEQDSEGTNVTLRTPTKDRKLQIGLEAQIRQAISKLDVGKLKIKFVVDESFSLEDSNKIPSIKNVIAIGSGKGGVGKSTVTINLASALAKSGYKVGVMDADIYGPSIGKMVGATGKIPLQAEEDKIWPLEKFGLKIISFSFLLEENSPVVWRGPMLGKAVEQFLYDIVWGELDYLLIDLPPGTGDVQLSLAQLTELTGAIIVTTPQKVATLDASRAITMFHQLKVPILGIVENMSYFIPPDMPDKKYNIFGQGGGKELAEKFNTELLGQIPHVMDLLESGEDGKPLVLKENKPILDAYNSIIQGLNTEIQKWS